MAQEEVILFLGPEDSPLLSWLSQNEKVIQTSERITTDYLEENAIKFAVSYGYRHILKKPVLERLPGRAVNLHIAYLPWNRGADPNFWSFVEGTPKGVTIHYIDEGIDTGDIIAQREVTFNSATETLATSYEKLQAELQELFKQYWFQIKTNNCPRLKQPSEGSFHRMKDKELLSHLLTDGWNTPVTLLESRLQNANEKPI